MAGKKIKKEDVEYLGLLSRINLSAEETASFVSEFEKILEYVSALSALDTAEVEPAYRIMKTAGVLRRDANETSMDREELLANAPEKTEKFFKVPKII